MSATSEHPIPLTLGVLATSNKPDERRLPIHPRHFDRIDAALRRSIMLESGYGDRFGISDRHLAPLVGRIASRAEIMADADIILLPKPQHEDLLAMRDGQILWGWPHCVQDRTMTQIAIDKHLTLIAFEAMNHWASDSGFGLHVFHMNNELAGYCSVLDTFRLCGMTGDYGRRLSAVVIGFGATARGAVTALNAHGVHDVDVVTNRGVAAVGSPIHSVRIVQLDQDENGPGASKVITKNGRRPLAQFLAESDIVVNCTLQDPNAPLTYLVEDDLDAFRPGSIIIDVSCDEGMGFSWAKPTTFQKPIIEIGDHVRYYAVDHSPSYLWDSATWEISEALMPFIEIVMGGPAAWELDEPISRAIEIRAGSIINPAILEFQHRSAAYPHLVA